MKPWDAVAILPLLLSCGPRDEYTLATHHEGTTLAAIGGLLEDVLVKERGWKFRSLSGHRYDAAGNVELVAKGEVDFAITSTVIPAAEASEVRTVLPLYPEVLVILHHASLGTPTSLDELLSGRRVGIGPKELRHSQLMLELIRGFGVEPSTFTPVYSPLEEMRPDGREMDVIFTFAGANRERIEDIIRGGARIFSLDDFKLDGQGSTVDGFRLKNPAFQSFVIPKNTFGKFPERPILTLAITVVLVSHRHMSDRVVYDLVSSVFDNANSLARANSVLGFLSSRIDEAKLSFPLHEGTRQYLNRDQPSFLERYAEVLALIVSIAAILFGVASSARRVLKRRKKDRIDVYYQAVQDVGRRTLDGALEIEAAIGELTELKTRAIRQLQEERLEADESFTIFLELVHHELHELERKRRV